MSKNIGEVRPVDIVNELSQNYLDYAMSVIVSRALPDIRDGLKPVQRRILYAMHTMNLGPSAKYSKSAKVVGEVLGKYHPHGDSSVYDAMVRLAQNFSLRYPLVDGQGNFGSVDGDPPAAMRYTEARMSKLAPLMMEDIQKDTVDMAENFDATLKEPMYLPAMMPNLLLMGTEGIAVGMATKIPPHHLGEVIDATIATIEKGKSTRPQKDQEQDAEFFIKKIDLIASGEGDDLSEEELTATEVSFESDITIPELVEFVPGPDFPTGGAIYDAASLVDVYQTGRGRIVVRGIAEIKEGARGKSIIEVTELPYQVNKAQFVAHIADLVRDKKIKGITALRDESDKKGMSVVIEIKKDARPKSILNNLYKHTKLQTTFPANFVALIDGTPHTINLKQALVEYVKHRQKVIVRRTIFELTAAKKRSHILEGLKIALDHLDEVIQTIRESRTQDDAKSNLIKKFGFTQIQAVAILDMQLRRLAALEREKIEQEYQEIAKLIERLVSILKNPQKVLDLIKNELSDVKEKYNDERRTKIYKQSLGQFSEEDLIPKKEVLITVTKTGYVKRVPRGTYKAQRRGGKGVLGMTTKEEDEIEHLISATTHDMILFFTDKGKVYGTKAWEIQESGRQAKGQALVNILDIDQNEVVRSVVPLDENSKFLISATKHGLIKRTSIKQYHNLRSNGLIAMKLSNSDELVTVASSSGKDHIMMITKSGKAIRFDETDARSMGRSTKGVRGITLNDNDEVISMEVFPSERDEPEDKRKKVFRDLLVLSEKGLGKRTKVKLFPVHKRAGKGVKASSVSAKTGNLAAAVIVTQDSDQIVVTSSKGQVIKLPIKNIPQMGRATQGVILMRFGKSGDKVAALTRLDQDTDEDEE